MRRIRLVLGNVGVLMLLAAPRLADACSVCQGGTINNRAEFISTTAFLTFMPLLMIGGIALYVRRRYVRLSQQPPVEGVPRVRIAAAAAPGPAGRVR